MIALQIGFLVVEITDEICFIHEISSCRKIIESQINNNSYEKVIIPFNIQCISNK